MPQPLSELQKALLVIIDHMTQGNSTIQLFKIDFEGLGNLDVLVQVKAVQEKLIIPGG